VKIVYPYGIFVKKSGDTMSGALTIDKSAVLGNEAVLKIVSGAGRNKRIAFEIGGTEYQSIFPDSADDSLTISAAGPEKLDAARKILASKQYAKAWVEVAEGSFATNGISTTFSGTISFANAFSVVLSVVATLCPAGAYTSQAHGIFLYPVSSTGVTYDVTFASAPASGQVYIVRVWALGY